MRFLFSCQRSLLFWVGFLSLTMTAQAAVHTAKRARWGMVAADHKEASKAGVEMLAKGGNAVDAACAAAFVLGVVNPAGSGIGGGGFLLLHLKGQKSPLVLDFREEAPAAAHRAMFLKKGLPKHASRNGGLAVGIPGEVKGCAYAVKKYGKLTLKQVLQPAIKYASQGFHVGEHLAGLLKFFGRRLKPFPHMAPYFPNGKPLARGVVFKRPRLAKALKAIADKGADVFYKGWIAKDIVNTVRKSGGILTMKDLANYRVKVRKAVSIDYRGYKVFSMPPPSSGGIAMIQTLNILKGLSLRKHGHNSSKSLFLLVEALQHSFADRARLLGDTDFVTVPIKKLLSEKYAKELRKRIGSKVLPFRKYGSGPATAANRDGGTSHLSVMDNAGNAVALTTTINTGFGSKLISTRSGIVLNNEMDDFSANPGKPNAFGLIQSKQNEIQAGKRPLSSMSPTIVLKKGQPVLALGGSGGPTIITGTLQVLLNVVEFGLELNDAVSRNRVHHQWLPGVLFLERDLPRDVIEALKARGHRVRFWPKPFTAVQAVQRLKQGFAGASDPRKHGSAVGLHQPPASSRPTTRPVKK
jgi:gamma-glutamyltranspeptidase/glutathione hydrolase